MKQNFKKVWSFLAAVTMLLNVLLPTGAVAAGDINSQLKAGVSVVDAPTNDYNFRSILGNGVYFGIVADTLDQGNHLQTNFAVNTYTGGASNVQPDLSGNSAGVIYAGHISDPFTINALGREVVIYTGDNLTPVNDPGKKDWKNENGTVMISSAGGAAGGRNVNVVHVDSNTINNSVIQPIIDHVSDVSDAMVKHAQTPNIVNEELSTFKCLVLDTTQYDPKATIYVDADQYKDIIGGYNGNGHQQNPPTEGLNIIKHPDQVIVFNFDSTSKPIIKQYTVNSTLSDTDITATAGNISKDKIAQTIVWNINNTVTDVKLGAISGIVLAPNATNVEVAAQEAGSSGAGWIVTGGKVYNKNGEWHNIFQGMPQVHKVNFVARKMVNNDYASGNEVFNFKLERYNPQAIGNRWVDPVNKKNQASSIEFGNIALPARTEGWVVYRITETSVDNSTPEKNKYTTSRAVFYAGVYVTKVGSIYIPGPVQYFSSFDEVQYYFYSIDWTSGTSAEDAGLTNPVNKNTPEFNNTKVGESVTLEGTKKLKGRDFKEGDFFKFEISPVTTGAKLPVDEEGNTVSEIIIWPENGNVANFIFGKIGFTQQELQTGYWPFITYNNIEYVYKITETKGNISGITYDEHEEYVTVNASYNTTTRKLNVTKTVDSDGIYFENTYCAEGTGKINVEKVLTGREWTTNDSFKFTLTAGTNTAGAGVATPVPNTTEITIKKTDGVTTGEGDATATNYFKSFGDITFLKPGTYNYTVKEIKEGTGLGGVTYDTADHAVSITVIDDGNGHLVARENDTTIKTVQITNTYGGEGEGEIKVTKDLDGRDWTSTDKFTFTLTAGTNTAGEGVVTPMPDDVEIEITKDSASYTESFGKIKFVKPGTYTYYVQETVEEDEKLGGLNYDLAQKTITIKVIDNLDGTLGAEENDSLVKVQTITNTYGAEGEGEIKVTKDLDGRDWTSTDKFTFTLTAGTNTAGEGVVTPMPDDVEIEITKDSASYTESFGKIKFVKPGTYTYYVQETVEEDEKLGGLNYDLAQKTITIKVIDNLDGTLGAEENDSLVKVQTITNTYGAEGEGEIKVTKDLDGRDWTSTDKFTFTLTAGTNTAGEGVVTPMPDDVEIEITKDSANYTESFGKIKFVKPGTYTYYVQETVEEDEKLGGLNYDLAQKTITIKVIDNLDGTLGAEENDSLVKVQTITNTYGAEGEGEIKVTKDLDGRDWTSTDKFTFTLTAGTNTAGEGVVTPMPDDVEIEITKDSANYTESFGKIKFVKPGTYTYYVQETVEEDEKLGGLNYDLAQKTITIKVIDNLDGTLGAEENDSLVKVQTITNTYGGEGEGEIKVTKDLDGRDWTSTDKFTFTLTAGTNTAGEGVVTPMPDDVEIEITKDSASYTESFGKIKFVKPGTYTYYVQETVEEDEKLGGLNYDLAQKTITIKVIDNLDGTLGAEENDSLVKVQTITNTYGGEGEGEIKVTKDLDGRDWTSTDKFTFTLTAGTNTAGEGVVTPMPDDVEIEITKDSASYTESFGKIKFVKPGTYTYYVQETVEEDEKLGGLNYDLAQKTITIKVIDNLDGTLGAEENDSLVKVQTITNTYGAEGEGEIKVTKDLDGRDWTSTDKFTFTLTAGTNTAGEGVVTPMPDDVEIEITKDSASYTESFGKIKFVKPGTYTYYVQETVEEDEKLGGLNYDLAQKTITIKVIDNLDGTLGAEENDSLVKVQTITNTYGGEGEGEIKVTKDLDGRDWTSTDKFTFTLTAGTNTAGEGVVTPMPDDVEIEITKDSANYTESFGKIKFVKPGTYTYYVQETVEEDEKLGGLNYDLAQKTITIKVIDNLDGTLGAEENDSLVKVQTITNTYGGEGEGEIKVTKDLDGRDWTSTDKFTFTLTAGTNTAGEGVVTPMPDDVEIEITKDSASYTESFGKIKFVKPGTYTYYVQETVEEDEKLGGLNYDLAQKTITIKVIDNLDGTLGAEENDSLVKVQTITNTYGGEGEGEIKVTKDLDGRDWTSTDKFTFTLTAGTNTAGEGVVTPMPDDVEIEITKDSASYTESFGKIKFVKPGTYTYYVQETVEEDEKLGGLNYDLAQKTITIKVIDNLDGTLGAEENDSLVKVQTITNTYGAEGEGEIKVTKDLDGRDWTSTDKFTFTLTAGTNTAGEGVVTPMPDDVEIEITKDSASYTESFGKIKFVKPGTYTYYVQETVEEDEKLGGLNYDLTQKTITIKVIDNLDGTLGAEENDSLVKVQTITNTYGGEGEGEIKVTKDLDGRDWTSTDKFTFTLTAGTNTAGEGVVTPMPDDVEIEITKDSASYTESFGKIKFVKPGTYTYYVQETVEEDEKLGGLNYDLAQKTITIKVIDNLDGTLGAEENDSLVKVQTITNTYGAEGEGEIKVTKDLDGRDWTSTDKFTFTLTAGTNTAGEGVVTPMPDDVEIEITKDSASYTESFGKIKFVKPGTYTYYVQETVEEDEKLGGLNYDLAQKTITIKVIDNLDGTLGAEENDSLVKVQTITNTYGAEGEGEIKVTKDLDGRDWTSTDKFTFTLTAGTNTAGEGVVTPMPDDVEIEITKDSASYTESFGKIKFVKPGTYTYYVQETVEEDEKLGGLNYDLAQKTITIKVIDNLDGTLGAEENDSLVKVQTITNTYSAEGEGEIKVTKDLDGRDWTSTDKFTFTLTAGTNTAGEGVVTPMPDDVEIEITKDSASYTESFGKIKFVKPGTYTYYVQETVEEDEKLGGLNYDLAQKTITIKVIDNLDGTLGAEENDSLVKVQTITNTYGAEGEGEIKVTKDLDGRDWTSTDKFTFTLTAGTNTAGEGVVTPMPDDVEIEITKDSASYTESFGKIKFVKPGTYTYYVQETVEEDEKLGGLNYDLAQKTITIKVIDNLDGTLGAEENDSLVKVQTITNTYSAEGEGEIKVTKDLDGRDWTSTDKFTFTLTAGTNTAGEGVVTPMPDDVEIEITKDSASYTESFGKIKFVKPGTYTYYVQETVEEDEKLGGLNYDLAQKTITIKVIDNLDGTLGAEENDSLVKVQTITNTYSAEGEGEIKVTKDLDGRDWTSTDKFTFTLTAGTNTAGEGVVTPMPDDVEIEITKDSASYTESFGKIKFVKPGTYTYYVQETVEEDEKLGGLNYDLAQKTITIKVIDNLDGTLGAEENDSLVKVQTITNTYDSKGSVELGGKKILDGRYFMSGDTLTVEVYDGVVNENETENIKPLESVDVVLTPYIGKSSEAPYSIPAFEYDLEDVGGYGNETTFTYTVIEVANMADTTKTVGRHIVAVTLKDNCEGELIITGVTIDGNTVAQENLATALGEIDFLNTYHTTAEKQIMAKKDLKAMNLKPDAFTFTLTGNDDVIELIGDAANQTKTNDESGDVEFDPLKFAVNPTEAGYVDIANLPMVDGHYEFTLTLAESEDGLAENDIRIEGEKQYTIKVNVDYNPGNGVLAVSINPDEESFEFTNLKNATAQINVEAQKTMLGRQLKNGDFHFTVNGKVSEHHQQPIYTISQEATNTGERVVFDNLLFAVYPTEEQEKAGYIDVTDLVVDPGKYTFDLTVAEDLASLANKPEVIPVSPSTMSYKVTITLTYDKETGTLTAERDKEPEDLVFINRVVKVQKTDLAGNELTGSHIKILDEDGTVIDEWDSRTGEPHEVANRKDPSNPTALIPGKTYKLIETATPKVDGEGNWYYKFAGEATFMINGDGTIKPSGLDIRSEDGVLLLKDEIPEKPKSEKKIKDINDSTGIPSDWQDSADYDIGDEVPYRLTATLADNVTDYKQYHITFHDVMDEGLDFYEIKSVMVNNKIVTDYELTSTDHSFDLTLTWKGEGGAKIADEALNKGKIEVQFTAMLNENCVRGNIGNVNKSRLEYSNNPNDEQGAETEFTEWDSVICFTYKVVVNKVDETGDDPLEGAEFILTKLLPNDRELPLVTYHGPGGTQFIFDGLDDGIYRLEEIKHPNGYKPIDPITFEVKAGHADIWDGTEATRTSVLETLSAVDERDNTAQGDLNTGDLKPIPIKFELVNNELTTSIKNETEETSTTIKKVWDDDEDRDGVRPGKLVVTLKAITKKAGTEVLGEYELSKDNNWMVRVDGLPKMKKGEQILYTWTEALSSEDKVNYPEDKIKIVGNTLGAVLTTITNVHTPETVEIKVQKKWVDNEIQAKKRPEIQVQLYADGEAIETAVLKESNGWSCSWTELKKCRDKDTNESRDIVYSIAELNVPDGYVCTITRDGEKSFVITNTFDTGKLIIEKEFAFEPWEPFGPDDSPMDIPVIKTWNDNNNKDGNRPASITVRLYADGVEVANAQLTEATKWRHTFTGMPRLTEEKEKIVYTITEDKVEWYEAEINGFNIRNNYKPELTSVSVKKVWDDNNNAQKKRPASIAMTLSNGMIVILSDENNWTATITDLPTKVDGKTVEYTWKEQQVLNYTNIGVTTDGSVTTFTNQIHAVNPATNKTNTPGRGKETEPIEDYKTPLGVNELINHVGDCFD